MKLFSFADFLLETENVKLDKELREYELIHVNNSLFKLKSTDFYKEFNVMPYNNETLKSLEEARSYLEKATEDLGVEEMYSAVTRAERIPYTYGNVFPVKFSLKSTSGINLVLEPDRQRVLDSSEKEFLSNEFSSLNKQVKDDIIDILRERCEVLCCVIEALFYYVKTIDTDNYYDGLNKKELTKHYSELIEKASKQDSFSFEGPYDTDLRSQLNDDSKIACWVCEKDMKKFVIRATVDPSELKSEDNVGGTQGLKFSLMKTEEKMPQKDYNYFSVDELSARIKLFNDKILKKL